MTSLVGLQRYIHLYIQVSRGIYLSGNYTPRTEGPGSGAGNRPELASPSSNMTVLVAVHRVCTAGCVQEWCTRAGYTGRVHLGRVHLGRVINPREAGIQVILLAGSPEPGLIPPHRGKQESWLFTGCGKPRAGRLESPPLHQNDQNRHFAQSQQR